MLQPKSVDVAINVYGKPYLTAVTLLSLMKQSGNWIDTIYVVEERHQPPQTDLTLLKELLKPYKVVYYRPWFYLGIANVLVSKRRHLLPFAPFRHSVRYQYAWEKTNKSRLFITHNDVLYTDDLVKAYLENVGDSIGIGKVGQCWNCPAYKEGVCDGDRYQHYRPSAAEVEALYQKHGDPRGGNYRNMLTDGIGWPLPECRLNEYACMVNLDVARPLTMPKGSALPFCLFGYIDLNTEWFREVNLRGQHPVNFDYDPYARHSWVNALNNGHRALSDRTIYDAEEEIARQYLETEFGVSTQQR